MRVDMDARSRQSVSIRVVLLLAAVVITPLARDAAAQANPPRSLAVNVLGRNVSLSWLPPDITQPLTGYVIEVAMTASGPTAVSLPLVGNGTSYFVRAVPDGRYFVRVRALFGATQSPPSNEVAVIVPAIPAAPATVVATVEQFTVSLTWHYGPNSSPVTGWVVHAGSQPGASDLAVVPVQATRQVLSATVGPGTFYARVFAVNESGSSPASAEVAITTGANICHLPSQPTGLNAVLVEGGVRLLWDLWSGYLPAGFVIAAGSGPGASDVGTFTVPRTMTVDAFPPPGTYYVRLAAYNSCGQSPFTPDIVFSVP